MIFAEKETEHPTFPSKIVIYYKLLNFSFFFFKFGTVEILKKKKIGIILTKILKLKNNKKNIFLNGTALIIIIQ